MNSKERIAAVLSGAPVDRLPVSIWGHNFLREWSADDLADETVGLYRTYKYDFVKINPRWTMFAEPWGNTYERPTTQAFPAELHHIVDAVEDLAKVPRIASDHAVFNEHLTAVRTISAQIGEDVDILGTVFSPLASVGLMTGLQGLSLIEIANQNPDALHDTLEHVTETLSAHASDLVAAGVSGIFFAPLKWTSMKSVSAEFYAEFGRPYDLRLLEAVKTAPFNVLHVCGNRIGMERFHDYPVSVLNWDNFGSENPSLSEVQCATGKVVAGGIPHLKLHQLDDDALLEQAATALDGLNDHVMLAGGCAVGAELGKAHRQAVTDMAVRLAQRTS